MKNNKDFNIFEYNQTQRTSATYEGYIYQAIEGFEIEEIIKPKIEAVRGDKKRMEELYWGVEKLISVLIEANDLNNILFNDGLKKL